MNTRIGLVLAILMAALLAGCGSMVAKQDKGAEPATFLGKDAPSDVRVLAKFFEAYGLLLSTGIQDCKEADCDVKIELELVDVKGVKYCIAKLPEELTFTNTKRGNPPKTITWTLVPVEGLSVEFHADNGILKVDDGGKQFTPDKGRTDRLTFKAKNKHDNQGSKSSYVPVILRLVGNTVELCGTGDPKIVNN
jgi:hypothetical protein